MNLKFVSNHFEWNNSISDLSTLYLSFLFLSSVDIRLEEMIEELIEVSVACPSPLGEVLVRPLRPLKGK